MVAGSCERTNMKISGSGNIHGGNFIAGSASVMISGSGDAYTNILDKLTGLISGSGNIYVKGDPDINVVLSGSGRVIKN